MVFEHGIAFTAVVNFEVRSESKLNYYSTIIYHIPNSNLTNSTTFFKQLPRESTFAAIPVAPYFLQQSQPSEELQRKNLYHHSLWIDHLQIP
jgi:hypothetical protein